MAELTLESLSRRVAELEQKMVQLTAPASPLEQDWRRTVGMFAEDEFSRAVDTEALAIREAERQAARAGVDG